MSANKQRFAASTPVTIDIAPKSEEKKDSATQNPTVKIITSPPKFIETKEPKSLSSPNSDVIRSPQSVSSAKESDGNHKNEQLNHVDTGKKTVMTLSVANLMSDPSTLNVVHNKSPTISIKNPPVPTISAQPAPKITIRTINQPTLTQPYIPQKITTDFQTLTGGPAIPLIQQNQNRKTNFNINMMTYNPQFFNAANGQNAQLPQATTIYSQKFVQNQYQPLISRQMNSSPKSTTTSATAIVGQYSNQIAISSVQRNPYPLPAVIMSTQSVNQMPQQMQIQQQTAIAHPPPSSIPPPPGKHQHDMQPPPPTYYIDEETGDKYGIRCTCGDNNKNNELVQCEKCQFWLHMMCVNIPRASSSEHFYCPFCLDRKLRCRCKKNKTYSQPILQCSHCKMWVHKSCEGLGFGIIPQPFLCSNCHRQPFDLPIVNFNPQERELRDFSVYIEPNRYEVVNNIPDGIFKTTVEQDLGNSELRFFDTIAKYFNKFCPHFFSHQSQEFWRIFVQTFSQIFGCETTTICNAIDTLAYRLLYAPSFMPYPDPVDQFGYSESISNFVQTSPVKEFESMPPQIPITLDRNGHVITPVPLPDGEYICDLPGFLMHTDEVYADYGIPACCLAVDDTDLIIDMSGTPFTIAPNFRRSFHPNASVRLISVAGRPRVALFAVKPHGPLYDEKVKLSGNIAIQQNSEIILPFDGDLPFPIDKKPWKEKKQRARVVQRVKEEKPKPKKKQPNSRKASSNAASIPPVPELTLLSPFLSDDIPPPHFNIISNEEMEEKKRSHEKAKERRTRNFSNSDFVFE